MDFGKRTIRVNGTDVDLDRSDLVIDSIDKAQRHAASEMAWWGSVWAAAEEEHLKADAYYRKWRAEAWNAVLEKEKSLAEHKIKARVEADKKFYRLKSAVAKAKHNSIVAEAMFKSYDKQGAMAKALGERKTKEYGSQGRTTRQRPESSRDDTSPKNRSADKKRLQGILAGKKGKG